MAKRKLSALALLVPWSLVWMLVKSNDSMVKAHPISTLELEAEDPRDRIVTLAKLYLEAWIEATETEKLSLINSLWFPIMRTPWVKGEPWSGVFVSQIVNRAYPGALMKTARHSLYAMAAWNGEGKYTLVPAYAATELLPGDIVLKPRPGQPELTLEDVRTNPPTHGDIIVEVSPTSVLTIGGNKVGGIATETYPRGPDGALLPPIFGVLRLKV